MTEPFSKRFGALPKPTELLRTEAPRRMRSALVQLLSETDRHTLMVAIKAICKAKRKVVPFVLQWNPRWEMLELEVLGDAQWYEVFDFIEILCAELDDHAVEEKINDLFVEFDIGWKVLRGRIETRGDELFEITVQKARNNLDLAGRLTRRRSLKKPWLACRDGPTPTRADQSCGRSAH
jgi:AbiJ N-terminal domain 4